MEFFECASAGETLMNALIVISITFAALIALYLLVKAFTYVLGLFIGKKPQAYLEAPESVEPAELCGSQNDGGEFSAGTLVLKNTDEKTAAMLMAIVADEAGLPLERLIFRSIKLVSEEQ